MQRVLLFDTDLRGHHADYIAYLIEFHQRNATFELIVVTDEKLSRRFEQTFSGNPQHLILVGIPENVISELYQKNILLRSYHEWKLFCNYARKYKSTHGVLMYFDVFQIGLIMALKAPCPVSGIYFRPDFHYEINGFKATLNAARKKWMLQLILRKTFVKNVFSLDRKAVEIIKEFGGSAAILPISDPVKSYDISPESIEKLKKGAKLGGNRRIFLLFGFLDERKGIEKVIEAVKLIPLKDRCCIKVILAGAIEPAYRQKLESTIAKNDLSDVFITVFEEVKGESIQRFFEISDYVLALYQHHVGMSQILVRAAISQKPLISADFGLMGEIVREKGLGLTIDSTNPTEISTALRKAINGEITADSVNMRLFAEQNSIEAFAETIFGNVLN